MLWKQKSSELWLTCMDLNTKFFHTSTACRRRYNFISSSRATDGSRLLGRENIGSFFVDHFSTLFGTSNPTFDDSLSALVHPIITDDENAALCIIPNESEIFLAITELGLNKSPGPDG